MKGRDLSIYSIFKHLLNTDSIADTVLQVSWGRAQDEAEDACDKILQSL